jgi:hypothetical protein
MVVTDCVFHLVIFPLKASADIFCPDPVYNYVFCHLKKSTSESEESFASCEVSLRTKLKILLVHFQSSKLKMLQALTNNKKRKQVSFAACKTALTLLSVAATHDESVKVAKLESKEETHSSVLWCRNKCHEGFIIADSLVHHELLLCPNRQITQPCINCNFGCQYRDGTWSDMQKHVQFECLKGPHVNLKNKLIVTADKLNKMVDSNQNWSNLLFSRTDFQEKHNSAVFEQFVFQKMSEGLYTGNLCGFNMMFHFQAILNFQVNQMCISIRCSSLNDKKFVPLAQVFSMVFFDGSTSHIEHDLQFKPVTEVVSKETLGCADFLWNNSSLSTTKSLFDSLRGFRMRVLIVEKKGIQ